MGARRDWNWNRGSLPLARNNEAVEGNEVEGADMALVGGGAGERRGFGEHEGQASR